MKSSGAAKKCGLNTTLLCLILQRGLYKSSTVAFYFNRLLDPADLKRAEGEKALDDLAPLLELLNQKPLTTGEWEKVAEVEGYTHATFFRKLNELEKAKLVQKDRKARTWSLAGTQLDLAANGPTPDTAETDDTFETFETSDTARTRIRSGHEVSSIKSVTSLNDNT